MPDRKTYNKRRAALKSERDSWFNHWQEITRYIHPRRGRYLSDRKQGGSKKHSNIVNNSATRALRTLQGGLMAGISSPSRPWFRLGSHDIEMNERKAVKNWLSETERRMREVFSRSNFYNSLHHIYGEEGAFGTASMLILEDAEDIIRCYPMTAGEFYIALDERGVVNTLYRELAMSVSQLAYRFGTDAMTTQTRAMLERQQIDKMVELIHVIEPRDVYDPESPLATQMPYRSVYYELHGAEDERFLGESGFEEFPAACPRWDVLSDDVYGTSLAMEALGDVKQLQLQEKRKAQAIDKMSAPPMTAPSSLRNRATTVLPGGVTYVDTQQGQQGFQPAYLVNPRVNELMLDIQNTENRIEKTFYSDLFLMLANSDRRQITAREIDERHEEKLLMLGPVLERQHTELLDVAIDRTFAIMARHGLISEAPPELEGQELKVEYISILAQAQKAVGTQSIDRLATYVTGLSQFNPEALDKVDWDQTIDEYGDNLGVPPKVVRSDDETDALREARQQAEQAAQAMAMAQQGAQTLQTASDIDADALQALTGA